MTEYTYAYCWRSGVVRFGRHVPEGALEILRAPKGSRTLKKAVRPWCRLAYDNKTLLVPGVPEAKNENTALEAVIKFASRTKEYMNKLEGQRHA